MTEAQRKYLADLAGKKGVTLTDTDNISVAKASSMIEELKAMPDVDFAPATEAEVKEINILTDNVLVELGKWNFQK